MLLRRTPFLVLLLVPFMGALAQDTRTTNKPVAIKVVEFGRVSDKKVRQAVELYWKEQTRLQLAGYIMTYGSDKDVERREKKISEAGFELSRHFGLPATIFVRGGRERDLKTVMWLIPEGAERPSP